MKGTLLLLALLVLGELSFKTTEACTPFFAGLSGVISGSRKWLYHELEAFNGTAEETVAFEKIQNCYKKGGIKNKLLEPQILEAMLDSPDCLEHYTEEAITEMKCLLIINFNQYKLKAIRSSVFVFTPIQDTSC